ncbi:hypothetical protein [Polyangium jinanense]|uniref:STAS/SEC14 domain-containing protein n=1 Tax=Polyangium jinanense TaxID=2829994 RepID=A0A9X3X083_9BACT|nr:hypothetical protein [Polyangium jinanense]MDC3952334.1 hypothetical protein [Polyangium jinanense]MDC3979963.1 hypothetical protein [Polyangium jinanense]
MADTPTLWVPGHTSLDAPFDIVPELARFEPPDVLVFCPAREMTTADAGRIAGFAVDAARRAGGLFTVSDLSKSLGHMSISAAIEFNRQFDTSFMRAGAIVVASYRMRAISETLVRAARLLKLDVAKAPVRYFEDHASARAWFDELRTSPT